MKVRSVLFPHSETPEIKVREAIERSTDLLITKSLREVRARKNEVPSSVTYQFSCVFLLMETSRELKTFVKVDRTINQNLITRA